jgi:NTE family protein
MKAYGVFEGGGARGYAHIGALRAAEDRGIEFVAVAGTSIGAAIAALVAAGYTGRELLTPADGTAQESGLFASDLEQQLLHQREYKRIKRLQRWMKAGGNWWTGSLPLISRYLYVAWWLTVLLSPFVFLFHGRLLRSVWSQSGATGTEKIRDWLNEQLRRKLGMPDGARVVFGELPIKLRVVVADLSAGDILVFGGPQHQQMEVAEAVAASLSYPLFFRPVRIGESIHVDGGLVSNFPAWVLDDVREAQQRSYPTFGFRLLDSAPEETWPGDGRPRFIGYAPRLLSAALNSRQSLESRRIDDYHPITLPTHIGTLDFHRLNYERAQLVKLGKEGVERYFKQHLGPRAPEAMEVALRGLSSLTLEVLNGTAGVRAYLIQRIGQQQVCRVVYSALMEGDADDTLLIRLDCNSQALCLRLREPVLMRVREVPAQDLIQPATKYLHAVRPTRVRHVYCVPIFENPQDWGQTIPMERREPIAALCIDFSDPEADDVLLLDPDVEDWIAVIAQAAGEFWWDDRLLTGIPELPVPSPPPSPDWHPLEQAAGYFVSHRKVRGPLKQEDAQKLDSLLRTIQTRTDEIQRHRLVAAAPS